MQVRRRSRQASKLNDKDEDTLMARLDMAHFETQAEKDWSDRLLELVQLGSWVALIWGYFNELRVYSASFELKGLNTGILELVFLI